MSILRLLALVAALVQAAPGAPTNLKILLNPTSPPGSLPAGVSLRDIDGGPTYYGTNGFTYATAPLTVDGVTYPGGWDDPNFFPIGLFLAPMHSQTDVNRWLDLNLNAFWLITGNSNLSLLRNNGFRGMIQAGELSQILSNNGGSLGAETMGLETYDEPVNPSQATGAITTVSCTHQNNRAWYVNFTWHWIGFGDSGGVPAPTLLSNRYTTPCGQQKHLDVQTIDIYWFAGGVGVGAYDGAEVYNLPSMTTDQNNRASHYGDNVDQIRPYQTGTGRFPAPLAVYVENGGPYTENTSGASYIKPAELNAAVWSTIIHGARFIKYFNHSFAGPADSNDNLANSYYSTIQSGQTISIYNQTKNTNDLVRQLAPVINSSSANGYVTVSPAPTSISDFTGFDVMAKYHNRGTGANNKFWIFSMPRWSKTLSNQTATFTIQNTGATQVTVINENRTIPVTNSGTRFTDTFATANTVHIYRVD